MSRQVLSGLLIVWMSCVTVACADAVEPFDQQKAGELTKITTDYGTWTAQVGHATIDHQHYISKPNCLRLLGGTDRTVTLTLTKSIEKPTQLSFVAERWTSRKPYKFRIEAQVDGDWKEIFNGDKKVAVGSGFRSSVQVELPASTSAIRLIGSAPKNSGTLIDDLRISQPSPMVIKSVETDQLATPVLIGPKSYPVLQVKITVSGNMNPAKVSALQINTNGCTDLKDIDQIAVYYTGTSSNFFSNKRKQFGNTKKSFTTDTFNGEQVLQDGVNYFWVAYKLNPKADILHQVDAGCSWVELGDGQKVKLKIQSPPMTKRLGIALRDAGDDGSKGYRIPGLATTNKGTLIAVYDIRYRGMGDLPGHIDVGMSRSTDGGQNWEPMKAVMDMGGNDPKWRYDGIGDPTVLVDRKTNTIWVAAAWSHGNRAWRGSGPGLEPAETGQFMLVKSEDDGKTWSKPINITKQIKDPKWCYLLQGPGKGITMRNGTIVFPAQFQDTPARL